jgi:hypothetical protein
MDKPVRVKRIAWIGALAVLSGWTVMASLQAPNGMLSGGVQYTRDMNFMSRVGFLNAIWRCLKAREFLYVFVWLLPLGLLRIKHMDRRWVWAVAGTFVIALILGGYNDALGNTARAFFNVAGPLLSLAAAEFLTLDTPEMG